MRCNDCKFWMRYHGSTEKGQCRVWGPDVIADVSGGGFLGIGGFSTTIKTVWPETNRDQWCGEYQAEKQPEAPAP